MDQQVYVCLCVCMKFQVLTQLAGCTNFSRMMEIKGPGGGYEESIRFTRLGGLKRIRLQTTDRSVARC